MVPAALLREMIELRAEMFGDQHVPLEISGPNGERCRTENCLARGRPSNEDQDVKGYCPHNPSRIRQDADHEVANRSPQRVIDGCGRRGDTGRKLSENERK